MCHSFQGGPTCVSTHGQSKPLKQTATKTCHLELESTIEHQNYKKKIIEGNNKRHVEVQAHFPQRLKAYEGTKEM
jgi:hypothetical protein